jgi:predicted RNA-binding protein with PIN domain
MTPSKPRKPGRTRKHDHYRVTVTYTDNEQSAKVFTDRERADKFAARQEKSPFVKSAQVVKLT